VARNHIDGAALRALVGAPLPSLERLVVSHNPLGDDGAIALASAHLPSLRSLDLTRTSIADAGARALAAAAARLPALAELYLGTNRIGLGGAAALYGSRTTPLERLVLAGNPHDSAEARRLAATVGATVAAPTLPPVSSVAG
jgi:hypothetical protein